MDTDPATPLRESVESSEITVLPGIYDAMSAKLAERAGFEAVFTSGFSIAATQLGLPDLGLMTASENVDRCRTLSGVVDVPLVADMDTGYGNALNVQRTVGDCIDAGVAGAILEDQRWPKRCGHMDNKEVVDTERHVHRIRAAADIREERDSDFLLIGRTDARATDGLEAAIERGRAYEDAGADVVFVEAPQSREELERVATAFDAPTFANMIEGGKTPLLEAAELEAIGFDIVVFPLTGLFAMTRAVGDAYETLAEDGITTGVDGVDFEQFEDVLGNEAYRERQREYAQSQRDTDTR